MRFANSNYASQGFRSLLLFINLPNSLVGFNKEGALERVCLDHESTCANDAVFHLVQPDLVQRAAPNVDRVTRLGGTIGQRVVKFLCFFHVLNVVLGQNTFEFTTMPTFAPAIIPFIPETPEYLFDIMPAANDVALIFVDHHSGTLRGGTGGEDHDSAGHIGIGDLEQRCRQRHCDAE